MKTKKAVIFGASGFGEVVKFYLDKDSKYEVVAFTATGQDSEGDFCGLPVVDFSAVETAYPPGEHEFFVAVGYRKLNRLRQEFCEAARAKGYPLLTYVCSRATVWEPEKLGDNVFIFEENTVQPFVEIGAGTILWSGNHIGHHSSIGPYCFISSHVVVSGHCTVGSHCFLGVNATVSEDLEIGDRNIIGAGANVQKNTDPDQVWLAERARLLPKSSDRFFR